MSVGSSESVQVRVELVGSKPPVWRSFIVPVRINLHQFHKAIQAVMGWEDAHLYEFRAGDEIAALPNTDSPPGGKNSRRERLDYWLEDGLTHMDYIYDLGDGWEHLITFGATCFDGPKVAEGSGACPPEDCGGLPGLEDLIEVLADPRDERHQELTEWVSGWKPEIFDLEAARKRLEKVRFGRGKR